MIAICNLVFMFLVSINDQLLNEFAFEKDTGYTGWKKY